MPSTVQDLFSAGGVRLGGVVKWGEPVPVARPGVYAVTLTANPSGLDGRLADCPLAEDALAELLRVRPELSLDGVRPTRAELAARLAAFWLADEVVLYVGLAGTSLRSRVGQYYDTALGARRPHAGGWFLKTLDVLPKVDVHYAACASVARAEARMLRAFARGVSATSRLELHDPERVMPFANREHPKGTRKRHGIRGATAPKKTQSARTKLPAGTSRVGNGARASAKESVTAHHRTLRVTASDLARGQIRIGRGATKRLFCILLAKRKSGTCQLPGRPGSSTPDARLARLALSGPARWRRAPRRSNDEQARRRGGLQRAYGLARPTG